MNKYTELLLKKLSSEITPEQFDFELAMWTFLPDTWEEASCVLVPPPMPEKLMEFYKMDPGLKAKLNVLAYLAQFNDYFTINSDVRNKNYGRLDWLKKIKQIIPANDLAHHEMLDGAIHRFNLALAGKPVIAARPAPVYAGSSHRDYE